LRVEYIENDKIPNAKQHPLLSLSLSAVHIFAAIPIYPPPLSPQGKYIKLIPIIYI
jgi:hypothetical protein